MDEALRGLARQADDSPAGARRYEQALEQAGQHEQLAARYRFKFLCPLRFEALRATETPGVRACDQCERSVTWVRTEAELAAQVAAGSCVAFSGRDLEAAFLDLAREPRLHSAPEPTRPCVVGSELARGRYDPDAVPTAAQEAVPAEFCRAYRCLPLGSRGETLLLAFGEPPPPSVAEDLAFMLNQPVECVVVDPAELEAGLEALEDDEEATVLMGDVYVEPPSPPRLTPEELGPALRRLAVLYGERFDRGEGDTSPRDHSRCDRRRYALTGLDPRLGPTARQDPDGLRAALWELAADPADPRPVAALELLTACRLEPPARILDHLEAHVAPADRLRVLRGLPLFVDEVAARALPLLLPLLEQPDLRSGALALVGCCRLPAARACVTQALLAGEAAQEPSRLAVLLSSAVFEPDAVARWEAWCAHPDVRVRGTALERMIEAAHPATIPALQAALATASSDTAIGQVSRALVRLLPPNDAYLRALALDPAQPLRTRMTVVETLAVDQPGGRYVVELLLDAPEDGLRRRALARLGELDDPHTRARLEQELGDPRADRWTQIVVLEALRQRGPTPATVAAVERFLTREGLEGGVRAQAERVLDELRSGAG